MASAPEHAAGAVDREAVIATVRTLITQLGLDDASDGLADTPQIGRAHV